MDFYYMVSKQFIQGSVQFRLKRILLTFECSQTLEIKGESVGQFHFYINCFFFKSHDTCLY
jgi:hypothetical protein